jgi:hypothetical protein
VLATLAGSTGAWLAVTGVLAALGAVLWWLLSRSRRDHADDLALTRANCLRALILLRMRCAPGDPHYTYMLVQELQVRGEAVQEALNQLREEGRIVGPWTSEHGVHYYHLTDEGMRDPLQP